MKFQVIKVLPILALLFLVACGGDKNTGNGDGTFCSQVVTSAYNPQTGETKDFPTPCDVPKGWRVGTPPVKEYGVKGHHKVETYTEKDKGEAVVYYPKDINKDDKTPLIFFAPGFNNSNSENYHSLLSFIASHGYSVIYAKDNSGSPQRMISRFEKMLEPDNDVLPYVDTTRIGVIGHSSGGGDTFKILDYFSKKGYGTKARFLMALDPYMAFGMSADDMKQLPDNTNMVIIQFGDNGQGFDKNGNPTNKTDSIIPLTEYSLLTSIAENKKDYQVVPNKTHGYASGSRPYSDMQGVLEPLDALMDYTFNGTKSAQKTALEVGSDTPYKDGLQKREANPADYNYGCENEFVYTKIDYCVLDLNSGKI